MKVCLSRYMLKGIRTVLRRGKEGDFFLLSDKVITKSGKTIIFEFKKDSLIKKILNNYSSLSNFCPECFI